MLAVNELVLRWVVRWEVQQVGALLACSWAERVLIGPESADSNLLAHILGANVGRVPCEEEEPAVCEGLPVVNQVVLNKVLSLLDANLAHIC